MAKEVGEVRVLACHRLNQPGLKKSLVHAMRCASVSLCVYVWSGVGVDVRGHQGMSLWLRSEDRSGDNAPKARRSAYKYESIALVGQ